MALHVALKRPDLFIGMVISAPLVEVDPAAAGAFTVSLLPDFTRSTMYTCTTSVLNASFISF